MSFLSSRAAKIPTFLLHFAEEAAESSDLGHWHLLCSTGFDQADSGGEPQGGYLSVCVCLFVCLFVVCVPVHLCVFVFVPAKFRELCRKHDEVV